MEKFSWFISLVEKLGLGWRISGNRNYVIKEVISGGYLEIEDS